jgi:hypothetical protein
MLNKEKILQDLADNPSIYTDELARMHGCSYNTMYSCLRGMGIKMPHKKRRTKHRVKDGTRPFKVLGCLINLPDETYANIAHLCSVTREYVSQVAAMARTEGILEDDEEEVEG